MKTLRSTRGSTNAAAASGRDALIRALVHDLRNPLNVVLTWAHLLGDARLDDESRRRALAGIRRESERQAKLLADVAEYCALTGARPLELAREEVDLRALVAAAVERARAAAVGSSAEVETRLDGAAADAIHLEGDSERLGRALRACLLHALEPANGARLAIVSLVARPRALEIEIADDGRGLTAAQARQLFEPVSGEGPGSGGLRFELPIAALVARRHGGRLDAASRGRGRGTTLRLRLPRPAQPAARSARRVRTTSSSVSGGVGFSR